MPIYPFVCPNGHGCEITLRMDNRDTPQICGKCGESLRRQMATGQPFTMWGGRWRDQWRDSSKERGGISDGMGPQAE